MWKWQLGGEGGEGERHGGAGFLKSNLFGWLLGCLRSAS